MAYSKYDALYRAIRVGDYTPHGCGSDDDDREEAEDSLRELPIGDMFYPSIGQSVDPELRDERSRGNTEEIRMREEQRLLTYLLTHSKAETDEKFSEEIKKACGYSPKVAGKA